jgi:hypothetical protein
MKFLLSTGRKRIVPTWLMLYQGRHQVEYEYKDGAEAYRKISHFMPDLILVNYAVKPSHGRLTIESVKKRKKTALPSLYILLMGPMPDNEKVKNIGSIVLPGILVTTLIYKHNLL